MREIRSPNRLAGIRRWADDEPLPARLRWTAGYFRFSGVAGIVSLVVAVAFLASGTGPLPRGVADHPGRFVGSLLIGAACSVGWYLTGEALYERRRSGGYVALATLLLPLIYSITGRGGGTSVLVSALGSLAILTSWKELE